MIRRAAQALAIAGLVLTGPVPPLHAQTAPALSPPPAVLAADQKAVYTRAFAAFDAGALEQARAIAREGKDRLAAKLFRWLDLQQPRSGAGFEDIAAFIDANPSWPNQDVLARRAEEALVDRTDDSVVLAWFALRGPTTADGAMRYIEALRRAGDNGKALKLVRDTWARSFFGAAQETMFLKRYRTLLGPDDHWLRLDRLLWDGRRDEAQRMLTRVDGDHRLLADARLRLATMAGGVDAALKKVPAHLSADPGLAYERMRWRRRKGQDAGAREALRDAPPDLGRPDLWWNERAFLARASINAGRMREAYAVANDHRMMTGSGLADAEFLSGWIALRFMNEPQKAREHFSRLYDAVRFPVSLSRGAYWAGRAAAAAGDSDAATLWYTRAAGFGATYYGQLAATALDPATRPAFPPALAATAEERAVFDKSELTRAAKLLQEIDQPRKMKTFITRLVLNAKTPSDHVLAAELAIRLDRPDLAVSAAKRSAQVAGVTIPDYGWPIIPLAASEAPERALVLATIRQESAFEADAISRAGARGLMQLMPATARAVAKRMDQPFDSLEQRLLTDPGYNTRLGRSYLAGLIDDYDGSYVLAVAAYNAGPGRVKQWIRDNGDPRSAGKDVVDWIELIPIDETRNYVQRVFENLQVYRQRLGAQTARIDEDLRRRRTVSQ